MFPDLDDSLVGKIFLKSLLADFFFVLYHPWSSTVLEFKVKLATVSRYSHLSNKRGGWNKRGGGTKVAKSIKMEGVFFGKNSI